MHNYLFIALLFCFQHAFAQDPPEKYTAVWMKVNSEQPGEKPVLKELEKLRKENPNDPWIYWISGIYCNPVNEVEEAAAFYKQAIAADSTFPHAYYNLAIGMTDTSEAVLLEVIDLYSKAVQYDPELGFAFLGRGDAYFALGKYDLAMTDCNRARRCTDFDFIQADRLELEILWKQQKKEEAFALVRKTEFSNGMWSTDFDLLLASIYEEMKDQRNACAAYRRAAEPYEMFGEEVPEKIANGLKKCK